MKILALADLHSRVSHSFISKLLYEHSPDVLVVLGDLTHFGPSESILKVLDFQETLVLVIPGNCDPPDMLEILKDFHVVNMHKNVFEYKHMRFVGLGGTDSKYINAGIDFSDLEAYDFLIHTLTRDSILLLHQPPYGLLDEVHGETTTIHAGNRGIRRAIDEISPRLVLAGHIHENSSSITYKSMVIVNPGAAMDAKYAIVEINKNINIKFYSKNSTMF